MVTETTLSAPTLLVAVPQLGDPNFARGVVLVIEHGEDGSMGLIINRESTLPMSAFYESQSMTYKGDGSQLVHQGGPVHTDRAFILHASAHCGPETEPIINGINLSYSMESLRLIADAPPADFRVYLGYAGWGPGQLAEEITAGAWLVGQPNHHLVFNAPSSHVWETALHDMGIEPVQLMHSGLVH